jgi:hypothetical protein
LPPDATRYQEGSDLYAAASARSSKIAAKGRGPWPEATLTVECTTGTPKVSIALTVETAFFRRSAGSVYRTVAS